jgi:starch phosphorylase
MKRVTTAARSAEHTEQRLEARIRNHARYSLGTVWEEANPRQLADAVSLAVREDVVARLLATERRYRAADPKRVYYLSIEFLMGRALGNTLCNLGTFDDWKRALATMNIDLDDMLEHEPDAALGNGGLGRLAACFLDSMATLDLPACGYGINYEFGLFRQRFDDGFQQERPDQWMNGSSPWLLQRPDEAVVVPLYGRIEHSEDANGEYNPLWLDWQVIVGIPHDMPIVGYGGRTVNTLRLFSARASQEFDMQIFNDGDYVRAIQEKIGSETISKVLYPFDAIVQGKELRLTQEYFLVACALRDIVRKYRRTHHNFEQFDQAVAIQLNDTHPTLAIPELMRILVDEQAMPWEQAWETTVRTFGYTNHTLLPEALEKWPVALMERVLPRHLQIIYEINRRFLDHVAVVATGDSDLARRVSIIEEGPVAQVRMGHLSIVGSHSTNGVAAMHSALVKTLLAPDFYRLWPERFGNKTNGITPRRWLLKANPDLAALITRTIGNGWCRHLEDLRSLEAHLADGEFLEQFRAIKRANKLRLARVIHDTTQVAVDASWMFDVQAKRIHEYKRQLLNAMHIVHQYLSIVEDGQTLATRRAYVFAGKAAPGYTIAKLIIRLINGIAETINADPRANDQIRVAFMPDYRVSLAEQIIPAADLSEQISTAGKEASGTGNMKFALNGALTIGTLDGANVEILQEVGADNIYVFGLTVPEIAALRGGGYDPQGWRASHPMVARVLDAIDSGRFSRGDAALFRPVLDRLLSHGDEYMHLADFEPYVAAQEQAGRDFGNQTEWTRRALLNTARVGFFSSDRTVAEYAHDIWQVKAV